MFEIMYQYLPNNIWWCLMTNYDNTTFYLQLQIFIVLKYNNNKIVYITNPRVVCCPHLPPSVTQMSKPTTHQHHNTSTTVHRHNHHNDTPQQYTATIHHHTAIDNTPYLNETPPRNLPSSFKNERELWIVVPPNTTLMPLFSGLARNSCTANDSSYVTPPTINTITSCGLQSCQYET